MEGNLIIPWREAQNKAFLPAHGVCKKPLEPGSPIPLCSMSLRGKSPFLSLPPSGSFLSVCHSFCSAAWRWWGLEGKAPSLGSGELHIIAHKRTWNWASHSLSKPPHQQDAAQNLITSPSAHSLLGGKPETLLVSQAERLFGGIFTGCCYTQIPAAHLTDVQVLFEPFSYYLCVFDNISGFMPT